MKNIRSNYKQSLLKEYDEPVYHSALEQIVENHPNDSIKVPALSMGNGTREQIEQSEYYLAP